MATFRVGQRVILARPDNPCNDGMTGRVRELWLFEKIGPDGPLDCSVDWDDGRQDSGEYGESRGYATHTEQLEPIQPDGMKPVAWESCLWQPEHMRQQA